jgi:putative transposase
MASPEGKIMTSFKGAHFVKDIILTCVRWYLAYPLSYRQVEELMQERGVSVDHATIHRWVLKYSAQLEATFQRRKCPVGRSWRDVLAENRVLAQVFGVAA